jgi:hypothetical protein
MEMERPKKWNKIKKNIKTKFLKNEERIITFPFYLKFPDKLQPTRK